jgi:amicoumacin kinase
MEERIKSRYNEAILQEAMRRYGITDGQIELLDGFESFMYEYKTDAGDYILRIGHTIRRSINLIQGEVHWINTLAAGGAGVAKAVESRQGNLVEVLDDGQGGHFLATAFVRAKGGPPWEKDSWNTPPVIENYGRSIGRMHAISRTYALSNPAWKRPEWDEDITFEITEWLPKSDTVALERFNTLMTYLQALPKSAETYGIVHFDAHPGNIFMDENNVFTHFDFDDCLYTWYMNDIAMVLFYNIMGGNNNPEFARKFITHFLKGYQEETDLDVSWLKQIPYFLKLREIDLYAIIHRSFDVNNLTDPWNIRYMDGRKERINNNLPVIDFDFEAFAAEL